MLKATQLKTTDRVSPLEQAQSLLGASRARKKREMTIPLPLTSLIDAFSIIVIYLLIGTQSGGMEGNVPNRMQLPMAESGQSLPLEELPVVRIEKGRYFVNDQAVSAAQLGAKLAELKKTLKPEQSELVIQADQKMDYADLDPLLRAGSEAGLQKLKFAVVPSR